jgi:hypothetical protein
MLNWSLPLAVWLTRRMTMRPGNDPCHRRVRPEFIVLVNSGLLFQDKISRVFLAKIFILIRCFSCSGSHMKKEAIIIIVAVVVLASIFIVVIVATLYPNPWGRSASGPYSRNTMGSGMMGTGMTGGMGMMALYSADSLPIAETDARNRAMAYTNRYYPGASIGDFMEFSLNYYGELKDASNMSIAEILVDRYTGAVTPEPGPNMMWNMGNRGQSSTASVAYDMAGGKSQAEKFLAGYLPGATIQDSTSFPGFYTFDFGWGQTEGMLSVNAYSGEIWVHTWHGQYIGG